MAERTEIGTYVRKQISSIAKSDSMLEQGASKARLAQLRRGIGKKPGEIPELWGSFLKNLPEELMSKNNKPSFAEWAIYTALTLFALHQQGHSELMHVEAEENHFGRAVRKLVQNEDDEENIRKKLSIAASSDDMTELSYHLKTMVKLLGNNGIKLDYVDLAEDLYWFQLEDLYWFQFDEQAGKIRLKWGQDFYRLVKIKDEGEDESDEE